MVVARMCLIVGVLMLGMTEWTEISSRDDGREYVKPPSLEESVKTIWSNLLIADPTLAADPDRARRIAVVLYSEALDNQPIVSPADLTPERISRASLNATLADNLIATHEPAKIRRVREEAYASGDEEIIISAELDTFYAAKKIAMNLATTAAGIAPHSHESSESFFLRPNGGLGSTYDILWDALGEFDLQGLLAVDPYTKELVAAREIWNHPDFQYAKEAYDIQKDFIAKTGLDSLNFEKTYEKYVLRNPNWREDIFTAESTFLVEARAEASETLREYRASALSCLNELTAYNNLDPASAGQMFAEINAKLPDPDDPNTDLDFLLSVPIHQAANDLAELMQSEGMAFESPSEPSPLLEEEEILMPSAGSEDPEEVPLEHYEGTSEGADKGTIEGVAEEKVKAPIYRSLFENVEKLIPFIEATSGRPISRSDLKAILNELERNGGSVESVTGRHPAARMVARMALYAQKNSIEALFNQLNSDSEDLLDFIDEKSSEAYVQAATSDWNAMDEPVGRATPEEGDVNSLTETPAPPAPPPATVAPRALRANHARESQNPSPPSIAARLEEAIGRPLLVEERNRLHLKIRENPQRAKSFLSASPEDQKALVSTLAKELRLSTIQIKGRSARPAFGDGKLASSPVDNRVRAVLAVTQAQWPNDVKLTCKPARCLQISKKFGVCLKYEESCEFKRTTYKTRRKRDGKGVETVVDRILTLGTLTRTVQLAVHGRANAALLGLREIKDRYQENRSGRECIREQRCSDFQNGRYQSVQMGPESSPSCDVSPLPGIQGQGIDLPFNFDCDSTLVPITQLSLTPTQFFIKNPADCAPTRSTD